MLSPEGLNEKRLRDAYRLCRTGSSLEASAISRTSPLAIPVESRLCKRIIPCLDVASGRTVKGVNFLNLKDVGDPAELAECYERQGADEIMLLDITASCERRATMLDVVGRVAERLSVPFSVGGGVATVDDAARLLDSGADKVTVNSQAVANPKLISDIAERFGSQCCVLAVDARRRRDDSKRGFEVLVKGGRVATGLEALVWAQEGIARGAGEVLLTSWDKDGTLDGFDIELTAMFASTLPVPVIASGGASGPQSFIDVFIQAGADAALAASIFHDGIWTVSSLKDRIIEAGVYVRPWSRRECHGQRVVPG